jgi:phenylpyruvate tautomerase PptA (4-oxalocrotonate tautomerase family)
MPSTRIATGDWARGLEPDIIQAVQAAILSALKVPDWDRDIVLDLYDRARRIVPGGRSEHFTRIEVELFSGRSMETKRVLYKAIVQNLSALGVPKDEIKIILLDVPTQNWGVLGGQAASEIELDFKVEI